MMQVTSPHNVMQFHWTPAKWKGPEKTKEETVKCESDSRKGSVMPHNTIHKGSKTQENNIIIDIDVIVYKFIDKKITPWWQILV